MRFERGVNGFSGITVSQSHPTQSHPIPTHIAIKIIIKKLEKYGIKSSTRRFISLSAAAADDVTNGIFQLWRQFRFSLISRCRVFQRNPDRDRRILTGIPPFPSLHTVPYKIVTNKLEKYRKLPDNFLEIFLQKTLKNAPNSTTTQSRAGINAYETVGN